MPRIPVRQEAVQMNVSNPVPIKNAEAFGARGESLQQFGKAVQGMGAVLLQQETRQAKADQIAKEAENRNRMDNEMRRIMEESKNQDDQVGYFNTNTRTALKGIINEQKDPEVRKSASQYAGLLHNNGLTQARMNQINTDETKLTYRISDLGKAAADRVRENPGNAEVEMTLFDEEVLKPLRDNNSLSAENYEKVSRAAKNTMADQLVTGLINNRQYRQAANLLRSTQQKGETDTRDYATPVSAGDALKMGLVDQAGHDKLVESGKDYQLQTIDKKGNKLTPGLADLMNSLTPQQKETALNRIQSQLKVNEGNRMQDLNVAISDLTNSALDGIKPDPAKVSKIHDQINSLNVPDVAKKTLHDTVNSAVTVGSAATALANSPESQWQAIINTVDRRGKDADDPTFNYTNRSKHMNELQSIAQNIREQRAKDPAGFVNQFVPDVQSMAKQAADNNPQATQSYINKTLSSQTSLGIPSIQQRILPANKAQELGQTLQATQYPEETVLLVDGMKQQYGPHFTRAISEIAGKNQEIQGLAILGYVNDNSSKQMIAANVKEGKSIRTEWGQKFTESTNKFNSAVSAEMDRYVGPLASSFTEGATVLRNAFFDQVQVEAMRRMSRGTSLSNSIRGATDDIIGKNFNVISGGRSEILLPKQNSKGIIDASKVRDFVTHYSQGQNFKKLGILGTGESEGATMDTAGGTETREQRLQRNSRWVLSPAMDGLMLVVKDPASGSEMAVFDKTKKPVFKTFKDIQTEQLQGEGIDWRYGF